MSDGLAHKWTRACIQTGTRACAQMRSKNRPGLDTNQHPGFRTNDHPGLHTSDHPAPGLAHKSGRACAQQKPLFGRACAQEKGVSAGLQYKRSPMKTGGVD